MAKVEMKASLKSKLEVVWKIVTDLENYAWRSDISEIEITDKGKKFVEVTKDGFRTNFEITKFEPMSIYEFDMENENIKGHWSGKFKETEQGTVEIEFTEDIEAKKLIMKPLIKGYLKKQQSAYLADLKKALGE